MTRPLTILPPPVSRTDETPLQVRPEHPIIRESRWDWRVWPGVVSMLVGIAVGGLWALFLIAVWP